MPLSAYYYDGRTARRHEVVLSFAGGLLTIAGAGVERHELLSQVRISERLGGGPRLLRFADEAYCEVRDHTALDAELAAAGIRPRAIEAWQGSWRIAVFALVVVVSCTAAAYRFALPIAAEMIAARVPPIINEKLSQATLAAFDQAGLKPSQLSPARRAALTKGYQRLDFLADGQVPALEFRSGAVLGPNAFALPDGTVVLLDELVNLARSDEEIYAVLAHEQGHVHYRHSLRMFLQGSVVAAVMTAWVGDVSTLLALVPSALLQTHYSREFEAEADAYAAQRLRAKGISPTRLADMLELIVAAKAERSGGKIEDGGFLATHPAAQERIRILRAAAAARAN